MLLQTYCIVRCLVTVLDWFWPLVCYGITAYEPTKKGRCSGGSSENCSGGSSEKSGRTRSPIQTCGAAYSADPASDGWIPTCPVVDNVRALMVRASSPMPVSDGHDEVSGLRKQLRHQQQAHRELQTMLQNQALAIDAFQSIWQMAGQEAHAFITRTRSQDFVRAELNAVQRFEDSLQRQYDGQLRSHVIALQDECREHVG